MKVTGDSFANALTAALKAYTADLEGDLDELKEDCANNAAKELKQNSPRDTGDFAKGWTKKKTKDGFIVHNRTNYQLTHLLEKGHAKREGGRVPPKVHIAPVEEKNMKAFVEGAKKVIKK